MAAVETANPAETQVVDNPVANGDEANINPLLIPTNKTADEIVAEIMAEVSDEGVRKSFEKMTQLEGELQSKIESMHTSFTDKMANIQADIDKFWSIDKEYEKYHNEMDRLLNESNEDVLSSDEIKQMIKDFKEGNYKEGMAKVNGKLDAKPNGVDEKPNGVDEKKLNSSNSSTDVSTEDVFDDASSTTSESSTVSLDNVDTKKVKSPRTKDSKGKGKSDDGKKTAKKKGVKN